MSAVFKRVIENIKHWLPDERALVAHCLISSLETVQDEGVDDAWAALSEKRLEALESGKTTGMSWGDIKDQVKAGDG